MPFWKSNPLRPTTIRAVLPCALALTLITGSVSRAEAEPSLHIERLPNAFSFTLADGTGTGPWVLQHSEDGSAWEDVQFMDDTTGNPALEVEPGILDAPDAPTAFFRAIQLRADDPFRRRFLTERAKWRLTGKITYQYALRQNSGRFFWSDLVNVTDDKVTSSAAIESPPLFFETPEIPTIEGLFERIADAIAADAHAITVTWDPDNGAPVSAYIDFDPAIADKERGWNILVIRDLPNPALQVEERAEGIAFHLAGTAGASPWLLQHSDDGNEWEDVQFWETGANGADPPELVVPWAVLSASDISGGLYRAIQLPTDDPFRREFIDARTKWRLAGIDSYQFELRQNFSMSEWRGVINVTNGEVSSFRTLEVWPPGFEPPAAPTVDDLFERLADAIADNAHVITATWDKNHGAPLAGYIDLEEFLADEERGWNILGFTPAP